MDFYTIKRHLIPYTGKSPIISIIGIPFDSTSIEFPGARFGPKEVRDIFSRQYGIDLNSGINIYDKIEDLGDIEVVHGSFDKTNEQISGFLKAFKKIRKTIPIFIGGEHSTTYSTVKELKKTEDFDLIVFDAHADCFETYAGEKMSHISYLHKLVFEKIIDNVNIIGARSIAEEEQDFINKNNISISSKEKVNIGKICKNTKKKIYLSIDIDVLDYHLAIGSGCPEYNGFKLEELINYVKEIIKHKEIVGVDIVETNPMLDGSRVTVYSSTFLLKEIVTELAKKTK